MNKGLYNQMTNAEHNAVKYNELTLEMLTEFALDLSKGKPPEEHREVAIITGKKMAIEIIIGRMCTVLSKTELDEMEAYLEEMMVEGLYRASRDGVYLIEDYE